MKRVTCMCAIAMLALLSGCVVMHTQSRSSSSLVSFLYPGSGPPPPPENAIPELRVPMRVGLAMLPVSAGWLVASRIGARLLGFDAVVVLLTATHFQYVGLAVPIHVALARRRASHRGLDAALIANVVGIVGVAAGISAPASPAVRITRPVAIISAS